MAISLLAMELMAAARPTWVLNRNPGAGRLVQLTQHSSAPSALLVSVRRRLWMPFGKPTQHVKTLDRWGGHALSCGKVSRHTAVRDVVLAVARQCATAPVRETPGFHPARPPDDGEPPHLCRPTDVGSLGPSCGRLLHQRSLSLALVRADYNSGLVFHVVESRKPRYTTLRLGVLRSG